MCVLGVVRTQICCGPTWCYMGCVCSGPSIRVTLLDWVKPLGQYERECYLILQYAARQVRGDALGHIDLFARTLGHSEEPGA